MDLPRSAWEAIWLSWTAEGFAQASKSHFFLETGNMNVDHG